MILLACFLLVAVAEANPAKILQLQSVENKVLNGDKAEACCGDLGCFSSDGVFFNIPNRPINSVPTCSLTSKLVLHLNTRRNPTTTQELDPYDLRSITKSNFNATKGTKILIHGFIDNWRWPWWMATVRELLASDDYNVIRLDWSHGNTIPYFQAAANSRLVGAYVAKFLLLLSDNFEVDLDNVHLIGHSLGSHASGYVGASLAKSGKQLGRITGLDPAGPYFTYLPEEVRLDPSDAKLVDTLITDGEPLFNSGITLGFGSAQPMGHVNFYPNGGLNQPGCKNGLGILSPLWSGPNMNASEFNTIGTIAASTFEVLCCSHARAVALFYESINNKACALKSFECDSYEKFLKGECFNCAGGKCAVLGYHAHQSIVEVGKMKKLYTITTDKTPFCSNPHRVTFKLQPKTSANNARKQDGWVYMTLHGSLLTSSRIQLNEDSMKLEPDQSYTFVFETPENLGVIQSIVFYWKADTSILNPLDWIRHNYLHLEPEIRLTEVDELVSVFQLSKNKIEEKHDTVAMLVHSFTQKKL